MWLPIIMANKVVYNMLLGCCSADVIRLSQTVN